MRLWNFSKQRKIKKYIFFLLLLFLFRCSTIQEVSLSSLKEKKWDVWIPKYISYIKEQVSYIDLTAFAQHKKKRGNESLLSREILIYKEPIQYEDNFWKIYPEKEKKKILDTLNILVLHIEKHITKQYSYINFIKNKKKSSHILQIFVQALPDSDQQFQILFLIKRKDQPDIQYQFSLSPLEILKGSDSRQVDILNSDGIFLKPVYTQYFSFSHSNKKAIIMNFKNIGKGEVSILSSTKNQLVIHSLEEEGKTKKVFQGFTPTNISLLEGTYVLWAKRRGMKWKKQKFIVREKKIERVMINWEDEEVSSNLNILSNDSIRVGVDEELKGMTPVYIPELYRGTYGIELSRQKGEENYIVLYRNNIELKEKETLNLFYPIRFYEKFDSYQFIANINRQFWFINRKKNQLQPKQIANDHIQLEPQQVLFTPHIILDNLRGESVLDCKQCQIVFLFQDEQKLILQKNQNLLYLYEGTEPLILKKIFSLKDSSRNLYLYWEYNNHSRSLDIYANTLWIGNININSPYMMVGFKNIGSREPLKLYEYYVSEQGRKNFFSRSIYFLGKKLYMFTHNQYQLK